MTKTSNKAVMVLHPYIQITFKARLATETETERKSEKVVFHRWTAGYVWWKKKKKKKARKKHLCKTLGAKRPTQVEKSG